MPRKQDERKGDIMPGGRPKIEIDKKQFESLCGLQCTQEEIADFFDCDTDTVQNWCKRTYKKGFSEVFRQKRGNGKISLRRMQWKLAETNPAMGIWLGKQYLGQREVHEIEISKKTSETITEIEKYVSGDDEGTN